MAQYEERDTFLEKLLRKLIACVVVLAIVIPFMTPEVFADASVSIGVTDTVKGGEKFTVTVSYTGGNVGRVNGGLIYDTDKLSYISGGSSSGDTGYVQLSKAGDDGAVNFELKFQAISEGSTTMSIDTIDVYDLNENLLSAPSTSKTIKITGNATKTEPVTETTAQETTRNQDSVQTYDKQLLGVDEKPDDENSGSGMMVLITITAIVAVLILIISVVLITRRKKKL